jgi:hypothetical protein
VKNLHRELPVATIACVARSCHISEYELATWSLLSALFAGLTATAPGPSPS